MSGTVFRRIIYLVRAIAFLLLIFSSWRVVFFAINSTSLSGAQWSSGLQAFLHGLRLDLAVAAYLLSPLLAFTVWKDVMAVYPSLLRRYMVVASGLVTLILFSNVILYHFWRSLLNYRAITYLKDPAEAIASVTFVQGLLLMFALAALTLVTTWSVRRFLHTTDVISPMNWKGRLLFLLVWSAGTVTAVRGGWQQLPINETQVFFSKDQFMNHTAVNPVWHLAYDIKMAGFTRSNPFETMPSELANQSVDGLMSGPTSTDRLLDTVQPNVVVLLLESFTADIIGAMHGDSSLTPTMDSLIASGVLFDRIYSSGFRTDQGIVSVLNGWPATPYHSIMRSTEKSQLLPSVVKVLEKDGYATSFYYGGAANFSNLGAYLQLQGFDRIVTQDSFRSVGARGRWGYHDEVTLAKQLDDLDKTAQPFFSTLVTLSNHEPFDVPGPARVQDTDEPGRFRNAVRYTDAALGEYFSKASTRPWFRNTLFVLVADHAHSLPKKRDILFPHGRHIPLILAGPVLVDGVRGKRIHILGGHHDVPRTLLTQLEKPVADFTWSKDLLSRNAPSFAYLPFDDNLVWKTEKGWFLYAYQPDSITERSFLYDAEDESTTLHTAKAFMQAHYGAYLDY